MRHAGVALAWHNTALEKCLQWKGSEFWLEDLGWVLVTAGIEGKARD